MKAFEMALGVSFSGIANGVVVVYIIWRFLGVGGGGGAMESILFWRCEIATLPTKRNDTIPNFKSGC